MKKYKVWDSADGSATPGRVFTASIAQEAIPAFGTKLNHLTMGVKGAVSTAAVAIEDFADLISPFTLRKGAENRIILTLEELCALMAFYYNEIPTFGENTDNTGNNFIGGLKIPVNDTFDPNAQFLVQADRNAVTNIATETVALYATADNGEEGKAPIHAVRIATTTSGTAGLETFGSSLPPVGKLIGLIIKTPNGFADGNVDVSMQKVKLLEETQVVAEFNSLADVTYPTVVDFVTPSPMMDLLRQFQFYDLRPAGFNTKDKRYTLQWDVQDVSDAVVLIPVFEIA